MTTSLKIRCWDGYQQPDFNRNFEASSNIQIEAENLLSDFETVRDIYSDSPADRCDILNINNAYVKKYLALKDCIQPLDKSRFEPYLSNLLPDFERFLHWTHLDDKLIGVPQRFGPFNIVINTNRISVKTAESEGFKMALDISNKNRFGILTYLDFNLFHLCVGSDLNPFKTLDIDEINRVKETANAWCSSAKLLSDNHFTLNKALINGDIDFYISGGVYTASPARRDGHKNIQAITPHHGPINGKGGIAFAEITSLIKTEELHPKAEDYIEYMLQAENAASIAFSSATCNPVAQMSDPDVFAKFSKEQLDIIQWESLSENLANCVDYDLLPSHQALWAMWLNQLGQHSNKTFS